MHESQVKYLEQDLKHVKNLNNLQVSNNYEKHYIIYYGYKYEENKNIYVINPNK